MKLIEFIQTILLFLIVQIIWYFVFGCPNISYKFDTISDILKFLFLLPSIISNKILSTKIDKNKIKDFVGITKDNWIIVSIISILVISVCFQILRATYLVSSVLVISETRLKLIFLVFFICTFFAGMLSKKYDSVLCISGIIISILVISFCLVWLFKESSGYSVNTGFKSLGICHTFCIDNESQMQYLSENIDNFNCVSLVNCSCMKHNMISVKLYNTTIRYNTVTEKGNHTIDNITVAFLNHTIDNRTIYPMIYER